MKLRLRSHLALAALGALMLAFASPPVARAKDEPTAKKKAPAKTAPAQKGDTITWERDLVAAFESAAKAGQPVMICINSKTVDGGREEPAAKGLREVIYKDPRVVGLSRQFVCVFLTPNASSKDYGELRARFGIEGMIVSPQHIFADPTENPKTPLFRREYWSYGSGEKGIEALVSMMETAARKFASRRGEEGAVKPPPGGDKKTPEPSAKDPEGKQPEKDAPIAPEDDAARQKWIEETIALIDTDAEERRQKAIKTLILNDKEGDCINPLIALLPELKKNEPAQIDLVRALGRPDLFDAAEPIAVFLKHKNKDLRANAAVSLEYIGSPDSVKPLRKYALKEKDENLANHLFRALGRCGAGESKVRQVLAKRARSAKSEFASLGAIIGLAYFEGDKKAARAVEDILQKIGPQTFGRRGGGRNTLKRVMLTWCLTEIGNPKSADFIRDKMLGPLENMQSRWLRRTVTFYEAAVKICEGDKKAKSDLNAGIVRVFEFMGGNDMMDDARKDRDRTKFTPKADWEIRGRGGDPLGGGGGGSR